MYFPFEEKYGMIWSEFFSDLLIKIGNSLDTFFRNMLRDRMFDSYPHVSNLKESGRKQDIKYFRDFFEPIYQLSGVEIDTAYGLTFYGRKCCPFKEFSSKKSPNWWTSYNHVKHEWFDRIEEATLANTIEALAGLFTLNVLHKESQEYLIRHQNVISYDYRKHMSRALIWNYFQASMMGVSKAWTMYNFKAVTPLFIHTFRIDEKATVWKYEPTTD